MCSLGTPKPNGTTCNDGNRCTQTDACADGQCRGGNAVVCTAQDQCHEAGVCDPATGVCSNPHKADGTTCNDGNACTRTDACQAGVCKGGNAVVCTAQDQCRAAGTCDPATGTCSNPPRTGARCDDGNACSYEDTCSAEGACVGKPITCTSDDFATRACNGTSTCTVTPRPGAACDDGNPCTKGDVRRADGSCAGMPYACPITACVVSSACDGNGGCRIVAKPDGTSCDADQSKCTPHDVCKGGVCTADSKPVTCIARDCNTATCDPATGNCVYRPTSGGPCGLSGCYTMGTCNDGKCSGTPKSCSMLDGPCTEGVCDAASGACMAAPKPNGTRCTAGGKCAEGAVCAFGVCELAPMTCPAPSAPCKLPACDPESGQCVEANRAPGSACDPANGCLTDAVCDMAGNCVGAPVPNGEPCTLAGGQVGRCAAGQCIASGTDSPSDASAAVRADAGADGPAGAPSMSTTGSTPKRSGGSSGCAAAGAGAGPGTAALLGVLAALRALRSRRRR
jgi:hypothetical protein